jgi:hypothetical protein
MKQLAILILGAVYSLHAATIELVNTIPNGSLFLQPPVATFGAGSALFGAGSGLADGFIAPTTVALNQISLAVAYEDFAEFGYTGRSPMSLTLLDDNGNSPGTIIESWIVPLNPADTNLTLVTVNSVTNALLLAGQQYWLAEIPTAAGTAIGWGLASAGYPGIQLPIAVGSVIGGWSATQMNLANEFSVSGTTIPEPATFIISAAWLLAATVISRITRRGRSRIEGQR